MIEKQIYLDFDGVICDSAFEAFRISLSVFGAIADPFDNTHDSLYPEFLKKRCYVGPAWNYHFVCQELLYNKWEAWTLNGDAECFQLKFFDMRSSARASNFERWLQLHQFYSEVISVLKASDVKLSILTNKDREPVETLLRFNDIRWQTVYSMTEFKEFKTKSIFFKTKYPIDNTTNRVKFIDDSYEIASDVVSKCDNVDVVQANWGYASRLIPGKNINLDEFGGWLSD